MRNKFSGHLIEFHIIQSFPVSCLNRDDDGSPKTAIVGGVKRARVSSQSWKRAIRQELNNLGVTLAKRTKNAVTPLKQSLDNLGATEEQATACAESIANSLGKDTLVFLKDSDYQALAELAQENGFDPKQIKEAHFKKALKSIYSKDLSGIDVALFGRMIAKINDINVEAAAAFNHAISTHKVEVDTDYFTALDDCTPSSQQGASHIGINFFNSATYYRYISLNLGQLVQTLFGDDEHIDQETLDSTLKAFIQALYLAIPTARQNTQSAASSWDFAKVLIRKGQRLQISFEKPITLDYTSNNQGYSDKSITHLKEQIMLKEKVSGSLFGKIAEFEVGLDPEFSIDDLVAGVQSEVNKLNV